jgi:hypothetical protein
MENVSTALWWERLSKHLDNLYERLEKLKDLDASPDRPSLLVDLPFEIRRQIYHQRIPTKRVVEVSNPYFSTGPKEEAESLGDGYINQNMNNLLLLSKQISEECLDILYGENIFKLWLNAGDELYLRKNFSEANWRRMRHLLLVAQPMGVSYTPGRVPDNALWASILPGLRTLRIVAEQPLQPGGYFNAPTLKQETDRWVNWIRPFYECFGQHLSTGAIVEVDDDGRETTSELAKCLPDGYRKVQCHLIGDLIFKRGHFSIESGYWDDPWSSESD